MNEKKTINIRLFVLILIVIAGGFLRFYKLDFQSFWTDEIGHTWASYNRSFHELIDEVINIDVHPPADHIFLYFIEKYIGSDEIKMRFPSAIFGTLSIIAVYFLGKKLFSTDEGIIAAAITAFAHFTIYYSQEARPYSLLFLLSIISFLLWLPIIQNITGNKKVKKGKIILYITTATLLTYLHYFGLYLVFLQGLAAFLLIYFKRKELSSIKNNLALISMIYGVVFILYIPWLPYFWRHLHSGPVYIQKPEANYFSKYFETIFNKSLLISIVAGYFLIALILRKLYKNANRERKWFGLLSSDMFLLLWVFIPISIIFIKSLFTVPVLDYKNIIICLPAIYLLTARGFTALPDLIQMFYISEIFRELSRRMDFQNLVIINRGFIEENYRSDLKLNRMVNPEVNKKNILLQFLTNIFPVLFSILLIFNLINVKEYYSLPVKEQFREAVRYIIENDNKYPQAEKIGYTHNSGYFDYYFIKMKSPDRILINAGEAKDISKTDSLLNLWNIKCFWYITAHIEPDPAFFAYLKKHYDLIIFREFIGLKVYLFQEEKE